MFTQPHIDNQHYLKIRNIIEDGVVNTNRILQSWSKHKGTGYVDNLGIYTNNVMSALKSTISRPLQQAFNSKSFVKKLELNVTVSPDRDHIRSVEVIISRYDHYPQHTRYVNMAFMELAYGELNTRAKLTSPDYYNTGNPNSSNEPRSVMIAPGEAIKPKAGVIVDFDFLNRFKF